MQVQSDCERFTVHSNGTAYDHKLKQFVPISMSAGPARYAKFSVNITIAGNMDRVVHRVIAKAFLENSNSHNEVNHKDLDKTNNSVDNLEWVTHQQNQKHYFNSNKGKAHQSLAGKANKGVTGSYGDCPICKMNRPMKGLDLHIEACRKKSGISVSWKLLDSLPVGLKTLRHVWEQLLSTERTS
jgi:hypothetical protein